MATSHPSGTKEYWREAARKRYANPEHRKQRQEVRKKRMGDRRDLINSIKEEMGCGACGWKGPGVAIDFDHTGGKRMNVSQAVSANRGLDFIRAEMARCTILCVCCHRVKTLADRKRKTAHSRYSACIAGRRAIFDAYKLERGCADCGYNGHACAIDFDHVRGEKRFDIGRGLWKYLDEIWAEVAKCDVICARCHRIRTHETKVSGHRRECPAIE